MTLGFQRLLVPDNWHYDSYCCMCSNRVGFTKRRVRLGDSHGCIVHLTDQTNKRIRDDNE